MMLCHRVATVCNDDGIYRKIIIRQDWYYTVREKLEQDEEFARLSGECRTYKVLPEEAERMITNATKRL